MHRPIRQAVKHTLSQPKSQTNPSYPFTVVKGKLAVVGALLAIVSLGEVGELEMGVVARDRGCADTHVHV
jgi:hypothetical protein